MFIFIIERIFYIFYNETCSRSPSFLQWPRFTYSITLTRQKHFKPTYELAFQMYD